MTLFCAGKDSHEEKWVGAKTGPHEATTLFSADEARSIGHFATHLRSITSLYSHIYVDLSPLSSTPRPSSPKSTSKSILRYLSSRRQGGESEIDEILESLSGSKRRSLAPRVAKLRAIKSPAELKVMRGAGDISGRALAKTMRFTRPGLSESAIAAHFEYMCCLAGSQRPAYVPVVASGPNSLIIHYTSNNQIVRENEMVLMDAGCEFNGYASDITRTYPASGRFTPAQRELYVAVLSAQKALIPLCTEASGMSLHDLHVRSMELLSIELRQLGFNSVSNTGRGGDLDVLFPHYLSHPMGIDLHESENFDRMAPLKAGMVITIEPGIYVPPTPNFPKWFHNMGIRIEDDVVVGKEHPIILSVSAPKEIADVEGACQGLLGFEAL